MQDVQRTGLKYSVQVSYFHHTLGERGELSQIMNYLQVHNQNESMLVGVLNMEEAMVPTTYVKQETQPMLNVEMKVCGMHP